LFKLKPKLEKHLHKYLKNDSKFYDSRIMDKKSYFYECEMLNFNKLSILCVNGLKINVPQLALLGVRRSINKKDSNELEGDRKTS
jgi:hypothetical protein